MHKPALKRMDDHHRAFTKLFQENCHRHRPHAVFSDFCEMAALAVSNAVDLSQRQAREERYLQIAKSYDRTELERFAQMLGCVTLALEDGMHDCLGKLFMALEMSNSFKGQFFTPWELCGLMARVTLTDARTQTEERGFIAVSEPAAGAGAMVIAMADALREQGLNYQQCMHVIAVDVDPTAAHMCYLQLSLLHVPAIVVVGNSLTLEERSHWYTPAHVLGGWGRKLRDRQAVADLRDLLMPAQTEQLSDRDQVEPLPPSLAATAEASTAASMVQADLF